MENKGLKFDTGKLRYDLVPPEALREIVKILTFGAAKYGAHNWKGVGKERYAAALMRHFEAWRMGEKKDEESGNHHLAHASCCLFFIMQMELEEANAEEADMVKELSTTIKGAYPKELRKISYMYELGENIEETINNGVNLNLKCGSCIETNPEHDCDGCSGYKKEGCNCE